MGGERFKCGMWVRIWWAVALSLTFLVTRASSAPGLVTIDLAAGPVNVFTPNDAFGAALDGTPAGVVDQLYTVHNVAAMKRAGLRPVTYSLRTELAIEAWHWSEEGEWSDAAHKQGYWTSSDHPKRRVLTGWGYILPRRGDSIDQANDDGYSRLDDGDPTTFWKSNPYLDASYTHQPARPQWVVVALKDSQPISAVRIGWARPFASRFRVQYWTSVDPYDDYGHWASFPLGTVTDGHGGDAVIPLASAPIKVRYVRILLEQSSGLAPPELNDPRDAMGYAIGEIGLGVIAPNGRFVDAIRHVRSGSEQTTIYVSSTDPWHRAGDRDPGVEQPGFDRLYASGVTNGLPLMVPVGPLYDTPENAAAEIRFLKSRGYPVRQVEIGMEPDGQNITPDDFADLYLQFASAVRSANPEIVVGGPSLQEAAGSTWLDDTKDHSWVRRFLSVLDARGRRADLGFFSFEQYSFDVLCGPLERKLLAEDGILRGEVGALRTAGVPSTIPWVITEYGFSAFSGRAEVELPSALFNADLVAQFLTLGGHGAYLLGYGPDRMFKPDQACAGYGELMLFGENHFGQTVWPTPSFWGANLLAKDWAQPGDSPHDLYRASVQLAGSDSQDWVVAYPVKRPDGRLAILLINRDPVHAHQVRLALRLKASAPLVYPSGPFDIVQYGPAQYLWRAAGSAGHPIRNEPPLRFSLPTGLASLPPYSITVVKMAAPG
jgi:hypothetical protein